MSAISEFFRLYGNYTGSKTARGSFSPGIKTQTNFGDSKIDISQDGAVLGSGNGEADATAFMSSDNIVLPVKVTAKDGATMNYKLFIEKASNNIALKIVEAKAQVAGTMMLTPVTATPVKMNEYVAEMPMGSEAATFRVVTEDPDTIIQLYDEDMKTLTGESVKGELRFGQKIGMLTDKSEYVLKIKVISKTGGAEQDYYLRAVSIPDGTEIKDMFVKGVDDPVERFKSAAVTGLTTYFASVPNKDAAHPAEKATVKIVPKNPEAVISIEGVANPDGKGEYITEVALTSSLVTEVNVVVQAPSGAKSQYKLYLSKYTYDYELIVRVNNEITERAGNTYIRRNALPFNVNSANVEVTVADREKGYQLSINGGALQKITVDRPIATAKVPLSGGVLTNFPVKVYDAAGQSIKEYTISVKKDQED